MRVLVVEDQAKMASLVQRGLREDGAAVDVAERAVATGHYTGALLTKDLVPLEPMVNEYKLYARGVGPVLTLKTSGGSGREELVAFER